MRLSSILSFESFQVKLRYPSWPLFLLALVAILELALRVPAITAALPSPGPTLWYAPLIQAKLDYFRYFEEHNGVDLLFIGDSTVQTGINPTVFDEEFQRKGNRSCGSFNGGIEGLPPYGVHLFLEIYLKYSNPTTVVYGLLPEDLNSYSPFVQQVTDQLKHCAIAQAEAQRDLKGWFFACLYRWSTLYRYRFIIHQLLLRGGRWETESHVYFDRRGFHAERERLSDVPSSLRGPLLHRQDHTLYSVKGVQTEELREVVHLCQQKGIRLILINMPVADSYYRTFENRDDYPNYLGMLQSIGKEYQLPVWDMENLPPDLDLVESDFSDLYHLNQVGARKLTKILADSLSQEPSQEFRLVQR